MIQNYLELRAGPAFLRSRCPICRDITILISVDTHSVFVQGLFCVESKDKGDVYTTSYTLYVNISGVIFVFLLLLLIFLAVFFICLAEIILAYVLTLAFIKSIGLMVLFCLQYFQQQLIQLLCSPPSCISYSFYVIKNNAELEKDDDLS